MIRKQDLIMFRKLIDETFDAMSSKEIAAYFIKANDSARVLVSDYLSRRPERHREVEALFKMNDDSHGAFLEDIE